MLNSDSSIYNPKSLLLAMPRMGKRALALGVDVALCVLTVWLAFYLVIPEIFISSHEQPV